MVAAGGTSVFARNDGDAGVISVRVGAHLARLHLSHLLLLCVGAGQWRAWHGAQRLTRHGARLEFGPVLALDVEGERVVLVMVALVACVRLGGFGTWIESRVGARSSFGAGEAGGSRCSSAQAGK